MNNLILILLEKVCEAIHFALFMIYGKNLKEKRLLFIGIMIAEYLMITKVLQYTIWIHLLYIFMTYVNLKVLYKEKAQITDIFLFMAASLILIAISIATGIFLFRFPNLYIYMLILNRILMFLVLFLLKNKINSFYKKIYSNWNKKKDKKDIKIRSLTLRNINIIIFNLMFYILNFFMLLEIAFIEKR